mgnify:FL=1|jgi:hypothetical protein
MIMSKSFRDQHGREWIDTRTMSLTAKLSIPTLNSYRRDGRLKEGVHWIQSEMNRKIFFAREAALEQIKSIAAQRQQQQQVQMEAARGKVVAVPICPDTRAALECIRMSDGWTKTTEEKIGDIVLSTHSEQMSVAQIASVLLQRASKTELEKLQS